MDNKVVVGIVSAAASILAALIATVSNRMTLKKTGSNSLELEKLKYELARQSAFSKVPEEQTINRIKAIDAIIHELQSVKDFITVELTSGRSLTNIGRLFSETQEIRKGYFDVYSENFVHLLKKEVTASHDAKKIVQTLELQMEIYILNGSASVVFTEEEKQSFQNSKERVNDIQNTLRDIKFSIIYKYE